MIASIPFTLLAILCVYGLTQVNRPTKSMYDREPPRSTPLNNAISDNQLGTLKKELLKGADVNLDTKYEGFPLINAIKKGNIEVVNILLEKGANVNCKDKYDDPALMVAINKKRKDIVKLLIEKGANVNIVEKLTGKTPLMFYAYDGNNEIVKLLLDKGAKLDKYNIISNNGGTYLMFFSAGGLLDYVKKLVETGADINDKDNHGRTALMYAKERKHLDVVNYLKSKGAIE